MPQPDGALTTLSPNDRVLCWVMRHGPYDKLVPANRKRPTEAELLRSGHLTPEGISQVRSRISEGIDGIYSIFSPEQVHFRVSHSPTHYRGEQRLGQRARDTAQVALAIINDLLDSRGLPARHLLNTAMSIREQGRVYFPGFEGRPSLPDKNLVEANMYKHPKFLSLLTQNSPEGSDDWYELFFQERFKELRKRMRVEGPKDIAQRVDKSIEDAVIYSQFLRDDKPRHTSMQTERIGRRELLVDLKLTHADVAICYAREVLGYHMGVREMGNLDSFGVAIDGDNNGRARFGGHEYKVGYDQMSCYRRSKMLER